MNSFQRELDRLQDEHRKLNRQNNEIRKLHQSVEYANRHPLRIEIPKERRNNRVTIVPFPIPFNRNNNNNHPQSKPPQLHHTDSIYIHDTIRVKEDTIGNYAFLSWLLSDTTKVSSPPFINEETSQPVKDTIVSKTTSALNLSAIPPIKIFFAINSFKVDKRYDSELDFIAGSLNKHKNYKIKISGYTDNSGPIAFNLQLSRKRANAVKQYLLRQGVLPEQIVTGFFGEQSPQASNHNTEGKVLNRRVEIRFWESK